MADTPAETRQANEKIPSKGKMNKYRWYIIGGLGAVAVLVFYFVSKSKQNAATGATGTSSLAAMGIDPATGVPYAQEYANSYGQGGGLGISPYGGLGGFPGGGGTGPTGPAGPPGKTGKRGKPGKPGKPGRTPKDRDRPPKRRGHRHSGSRTEAMTNALAARRDWNTRIIPGANVPTYTV